jgi:hypothetical protein
MTTVTIVLLILKYFGLISINWVTCFIPLMIDVGIGLVAYITYAVLVLTTDIKL